MSTYQHQGLVNSNKQVRRGYQQQLICHNCSIFNLVDNDGSVVYFFVTVINV